jgi:hypothetical protein
MDPSGEVVRTIPRPAGVNIMGWGDFGALVGVRLKHTLVRVDSFGSDVPLHRDSVDIVAIDGGTGEITRIIGTALGKEAIYGGRENVPRSGLSSYRDLSIVVAGDQVVLGDQH